MGNYQVRFGGQGNQSTDPTININDGYFLSILSRPYLFILSRTTEGYVLNVAMISTKAGRIKAINRVGPHNKEILSIIIGGMLPSFSIIKKVYFSSTSTVRGKRLSKLEREKFNLPYPPPSYTPPFLCYSTKRRIFFIKKRGGGGLSHHWWRPRLLI
jgi:hypothetical protein